MNLTKGWLAILLVTLFLLGCSSDPSTRHFYLGSKVTVDGVEIDPVARTIKNDPEKKARTDWIGISRTPLIGIDFIGLQWAPWIGCRLGYLFDVGADMGLAFNSDKLATSRMDATFGLDYVLTGDVLLTCHFEQDIDGQPLKLGYGTCLVW